MTSLLLENLAWWDRGRDRITTRWMESCFSALDDDFAAGSDPAPGHGAAQTS
ncbi:hypothetical protein [Streptomyces sp. NPDC058382]|uniref:hypothetical protein n=1 Tax=unclassified Streptomyces TaxID=2593676 RepID=UPI00363F429D